MFPRHYADHASYHGTFIIAKMSIICPTASGFPHLPGIWMDDQVLAWKAVMSALHAKGSHIYLQIG
jgi:NADPH2 dehydrogenase